MCISLISFIYACHRKINSLLFRFWNQPKKFFSVIIFINVFVFGTMLLQTFYKTNPIINKPIFDMLIWGIWSHMDLSRSSRALRLSFRSCSSNCKTQLFSGQFSQEFEFTICDGELFKHKQKQKLLRFIIMTHGYRPALFMVASSQLIKSESPCIQKHFISLQTTSNHANWMCACRISRKAYGHGLVWLLNISATICFSKPLTI